MVALSDVAVDVAVPYGSPAPGVENPSGCTRVHARDSVATAITQRARRKATAGVSTAARVRRFGQIVYLDAADSWWLNGRTVSAREVFSAEYAAPGNYLPFRLWCRLYRYPATAYAFWSDGRKWLLVHPVRGPLTFLFLLISAALAGLAVVG